MIVIAVTALELLISRIFKKLFQSRANAEEKSESGHTEPVRDIVSEKTTTQEELKAAEPIKVSERPKQILLAAKYPRLSQIYEKLN